jgi:hypothetical protein
MYLLPQPWRPRAPRALIATRFCYACRSHTPINLLCIGLVKPRGREVAAEVASPIKSRVWGALSAGFFEPNSRNSKYSTADEVKPVEEMQKRTAKQKRQLLTK